VLPTLIIGQCNDDAKAILDKEGVQTPTKKQIKEALEHTKGKLHTIIFL